MYSLNNMNGRFHCESGIFELYKGVFIIIIKHFIYLLFYIFDIIKALIILLVFIFFYKKSILTNLFYL